MVSVQQPKDLKGNPVNEPLLIIEGIEKEDIPDDGCCHMPIERDSAKELIGVLAKIVLLMLINKVRFTIATNIY